MTFRALAGGGQACAYCGFCLVMEGPRQCCPAGRDYDALAARLAEEEREYDELNNDYVLVRESRNELVAQSVEAERLIRWACDLHSGVRPSSADDWKRQAVAYLTSTADQPPEVQK